MVNSTLNPESHLFPIYRIDSTIEATRDQWSCMRRKGIAVLRTAISGLILSYKAANSDTSGPWESIRNSMVLKQAYLISGIALLISSIYLIIPSVILSQSIHDEVSNALPILSIENIRHHTEVLGHDSLGGRGTGSPGIRKAGYYIARHLKAYDLEPIGDNQSYFQRFPLHGAIPLPSTRFEIIVDDSILPLRLYDDYVLFNTGAHTFLPTRLPLVFVGYGILAPEFDYNDYRDIDVENKIVVFLSGEPPSENPGYFDGVKPTIYSEPIMKQRIALAHGAAGSIMIPLPREGRFADWEYWKTQFSFEDLRLPYGTAENLSAMVNESVAEIIFASARMSWSDILEREMAGRLRSFALRTEARFIGRFDVRDFLAENVVGLIPGSDPLLKDNYIILAAHYDHLGIGHPVNGDSIYNGVVDNALGCAALLEIIRVISMSRHPARSIVTLFVSGEEKGLLGSRYYCSHPLVPLYKTDAALNIDGIAIIDEFNTITGIGSELSTLGSLLEETASYLGMSVSSVPGIFLERDPYESSDQLAFATAGIPSILVMEGHDYRTLPGDEGFIKFLEWGFERYHTPFDDLLQPINYNAVRQHTCLLYTFSFVLADTYKPPQWLRNSAFMNARLRSLAEKR